MAPSKLFEKIAIVGVSSSYSRCDFFSCRF
jgi:hypothetical protein